MAWAFLALLILIAGGVGLAMTLLPRRDWFLAELAGLSVPFGVLVTTAGWFLLSFVLRDSALRWAVTALCLGLFEMGLRRSLSLPSRLRAEIGWLPGAIWLFQIAVVTWQSFGCPLGADGLFIWELKAKLAFLNGGQIPSAYFGAAWRDLHPTYPLCVPLTQTWIFSWLGQTHQGAVKLLGPLFFASGIGLLWTAVRRTTGSVRSAAIASTLLFFVPWMMFKPGGAASAWADFPLAVGYLAALMFALEHGSKERSGLARKGGDPLQSGSGVSPLCVSRSAAGRRCHFWDHARSLASAGLSLALLPWIKQEGGVLAGAVVAALAIRAWMDRPSVTQASRLCPTPGDRRDACATLRRCAPVLFLAAPAAVIVLWRWYLSVNHAAANADFLPVSMDTLADNLHRLVPVGVLFSRELLDVGHWGMLWPFALLALADIQSRFPRESLVLALAILAPAAVYAASYVFSAWPSVIVHINTSLARLLIPLAMPALIAIGLALPTERKACKPDS